jgi:predicted Zn-dependent protease
MPRSSARLWAQGQAAALAGDWNAALRSWRSLNAMNSATSGTYLGEAQTCLALGLAAQAERNLHRVIATDPTDPEAWHLLLEILQVEDRTLEAQDVGWQGYLQIRPEGRRRLLRELTLVLLGELPYEPIRATLYRWVDTDNTDVDAHVALLGRIATQPHASDPGRPSVLASLESVLAGHPDHVGARELLIATLADAGEPDRGGATLNGWPVVARDVRYWRLRGRWKLEYERHPDRAIVPFQTTLSDVPQDWQSWYRLARALHMVGRKGASHQAAKALSRVREVFNALTLNFQLDAAFYPANDATTLSNLGRLCERSRLVHLAAAWQNEAQIKSQSRRSPAP